MATSKFGAAFRAARASGDKEFTFEGKKYNTRMAPEDQQSVGGKLKMGESKPRREPEPLTSTIKPGTNVNYENSETSDMTYKRGGSVKASKMGGVKTAKPSYGSASSRADGIASKGKTRGKYI
jgi:hypothetical protein